MSTFKISRGIESNLPSQLIDGQVYFCTDTGSLFIDYYDSLNNLVRQKISAEYADTLRYIQNDEPVNAPEGSLWLDLDSDFPDDTPSKDTIITDITLTQSGKAADAKAVGDAINQLSFNINSIDSLPPCNTSNNGQILCVSNGIATWKTINVWSGGSY